MKIRLVAPWYGEFAGGAEFAVRRLAENLLKKGIDVGVLTTCCRTPFEDWWSDYYLPGDYEVNGVKVSRFSVNKELSDLYHQVNYKIIHKLPISRESELDFMRGNINSHFLISFLKKHKECIYVFNPYLYGPIYWGVNAVPERSVLLPSLHDEEIANWSIVREMFLKARKVIFQSEEEQAITERLYGAKMRSMPILGMGVDTGISYDASRFREKYKVNNRFIVYAGRKDRGKNVLLLIDYFKRYLELHQNDLKLVFIGGGDPSLIPQNDRRFIDLGFVPMQDKYDAVAASVALCNLSENESFSFVIMESWLTGRPVIVSSMCAVTKGHCIKSEGGFPVSDANEFCKGLHNLVQDDALSAKMGEAGRSYVLKNYSWDAVISRYIEMFRELE